MQQCEEQSSKPTYKYQIVVVVVVVDVVVIVVVAVAGAGGGGGSGVVVFVMPVAALFFVHPPALTGMSSATTEAMRGHSR